VGGDAGGPDLGDAVGVGVEGVLAGAQDLGADAHLAGAGEHEGSGLAGGAGLDEALDLDAGGLAEVGGEDGDLAVDDLGGGDHLDAVELGVEAVLAGGQDGDLLALPALAGGEEVAGVEHALDVLGVPLVGEELALVHGDAVGGLDDADLAGLDLDEGDGLDGVDDGEDPEVPAGGEDIGLDAVLAVDGDDLAVLKVAAQGVLGEDADLIGADVGGGAEAQREDQDDEGAEGGDPAHGRGGLGQQGQDPQDDGDDEKYPSDAHW
jgi:hypothetical protein